MKSETQGYITRNSLSFWRATIALSLGGFAIFINFHMTQPLLPLFSKEFGISPAISSLSTSFVILTLSIFLLIFGPVSDAIGRKNIMAFGLLLSSLTSVAIFFVHSFPLLLLLRAVQGIFLAALPAVTYAYIGEEFEKNAVGIAIGLYISATSVGGMLGRIISGIVADWWGWDYSFLVLGLVGIACFLPFIILLPASRHFKAHHFSWEKGISEITFHWKNPVLRDAYYTAGIIFFVFVALFNYLGYHLHQAPYNLSTSLIGLLYLTFLAGTFSSILSGKLDRIFNITQRIFAGLLFMLVGIFFMLFKPLFLIIIGITLVCFGFFFAHAASSNWVSLHAKEAKASASAIYLFAYYLGGATGGTLLGFVWEHSGWTAVALICASVVMLGGLFVRRMSQY